VQQGTGQSGWLFTLTPGQAAAFTGFASNQNVLAAIDQAIFTGSGCCQASDGPENIFAVSVVNPVPGPIAGAGLPGLLAACGGLIALARRRRKQVVA
jgi:hypothetical protein